MPRKPNNPVPNNHTEAGRDTEEIRGKPVSKAKGEAGIGGSPSRELPS